MNTQEVINAQKAERTQRVDAIINSKAKRKLIIAGAGTGKTYTFKELLKTKGKEENIALTFINSLAFDMGAVLDNLAEVKTFHAYCKKILHKFNGRVDLFPFLTQIIQEDARYLGLALNDFDLHFQMLHEGSEEITFYLVRGDYYNAVSFNDSVYRLLKILKNDPNTVPTFNQILIDEFQDFNPLEVSFINELEKKGNILIVGDDDQSVYDGRCASPEFLRQKYLSKEYEIFELPFCGRCPEPIVAATASLLNNAEKAGYLEGRISKRFECYIGQKGHDSTRFPNIITAQCTTGKTVAKYIKQVIDNIEIEDIEESWREGSEYSTVLITGPKQYLTIIQKELTEDFPQLVYKHTEQAELRVIDGYNILLNDYDSNLGWRILLDFYFSRKEICKIIRSCNTSNSIFNHLNSGFLNEQERVLDIIRSIQQGQEFKFDELKRCTHGYTKELINYYSPETEGTKLLAPDKTKPSILLSSFVGCKGLSAGHVIIVGANNGSIPRDPHRIRDIEIAQFLVALTRTRKQCHVISDRWLIAPSLKGVYQKANDKTSFLEWIPNKLLYNLGYLTAKDI